MSRFALMTMFLMGLAGCGNDGAPRAAVNPPLWVLYTPDQVSDIQDQLRTLGYYPRPTLRYWSKDAERAMALFQRDNGMPASGFPTIPGIGVLNEQYAAATHQVTTASR